MDRPESPDNAPGRATYYDGAIDYPRMRDLPARQRPRELMDRLGAEHVGEDVLLAILLGCGSRGLNVADLAQRMLRRFKTLTAMARATPAELMDFKGVGRAKALTLKAALELGRRLYEESRDGRPVRIRTPDDVARLLLPQTRLLDTEVFWVLHMNPRNQLNGEPHVVTRGLLDASLVHPREVFRDAIRSSVAAVVVAHNHPSGDPSPSAEDLRITKQLIEAGRIVDIKVLDHVILGRPDGGDQVSHLSLREAGLVTF